MHCIYEGRKKENNILVPLYHYSGYCLDCFVSWFKKYFLISSPPFYFHILFIFNCYWNIIISHFYLLLNFDIIENLNIDGGIDHSQNKIIFLIKRKYWKPDPLFNLHIKFLTNPVINPQFRKSPEKTCTEIKMNYWFRTLRFKLFVPFFISKLGKCQWNCQKFRVLKWKHN